MDPENRQDDFWITVTLFLVWYSPHVQESRSKYLKNFLGALFEKIPNKILFCTQKLLSR